jgi:DNA-binding NarL/FixJ family response regulator
MVKITCLIVDDERDARDRLRSLLEKFDQVEILGQAGEAEEAIEKTIKLNPHVVFLDVEMPRKSGFEVVNDLREKNLNPTFIIVTGYNQYAIKAIRNAAFDYILKPIDIDELREALDRYAVQRDKISKVPETFILKYAFTQREVEVVNLLLQNKTSVEIGETLYLSKHTVDTHRRNILHKTKCSSTFELVSLIKR